MILQFMFFGGLVGKLLIVPYRIPQLHPPLWMLALGKSGEGAYMQDPYISVLWPSTNIECHMGAWFLYFFLLFGGQNLR